MKNKKMVLTALCVGALVVASVLGTIAYLTDRSSITNTFTVGDIDITIDETVVNEEGQPLDKDGNVAEKEEDYIRTEEKVNEVVGNNYHLIPGKSYMKDPRVTVKANSEDSYVRMILTIHNKTAVKAIVDNPAHGLNGDYKGLLEGWSADWIYVGFEEDADTISFEFRYKEIVEGGETDTVLEPLFNSVNPPATLNNEELKALYGDSSTYQDDFKMVVEAHAIQAATFDDADGAWEAFDAQHTTR